MNLERQQAIKTLWETVVSNREIKHTLDTRKIRGYDREKLTFVSDNEYVLIKTTALGKDTYNVFKPISLKQRFVEALIEKIKDRVAASVV